eukprot:441280-Pelagomonas_calceolata.AAC.1
MIELGCYTNEQRQDVDNNNYWACPTCAHLNEDEKFNLKSNSHSKELVRIAWVPCWEPEDTKETWPTFLQHIVEFETHKDEPNLSIPAAELALINLERQEFGREDRNNTWKPKLDKELCNKVTLDVNPTNPQADIMGTGR